MKSKFLWYTDTHLDMVFPWSKRQLITHINKENPSGIFITGDISNGKSTPKDLEYLASNIECPIYFVLGNHDFHFSSMKSIYDSIRELCVKHNNLIWMTESSPQYINNNTAVIGTEGWYDAMVGNPFYIRFTFDWFQIKEFLAMSSMKERIDGFRDLASKSCEIIEKQLLKVCHNNEVETIYLLTHFPCWIEATRDVGTLMEKFWLPYNTNLRLGKLIEKIMKEFPSKRLIVISGHTHEDCHVHITNNIECKVNKAKYLGAHRNEEYIFI